MTGAGDQQEQEITRSFRATSPDEQERPHNPALDPQLLMSGMDYLAHAVWILRLPMHLLQQQGVQVRCTSHHKHVQCAVLTGCTLPRPPPLLPTPAGARLSGGPCHRQPSMCIAVAQGCWKKQVLNQPANQPIDHTKQVSCLLRTPLTQAVFVASSRLIPAALHVTSHASRQWHQLPLHPEHKLRILLLRILIHT